MVVDALGDRAREQCAGRIDSLENALQVDATCDFLNKDGGEALGAQLLVHTEKVDLHNLQHLVHTESSGDGADESQQLLVGHSTHTHVPVVAPAWWLEGPLEKALGVIEAKRGTVVLNVVVAQQRVDLIHRALVIDVQGHPLKPFGQIQAILRNFLGTLDGAWRQGRLFIQLRHGLCVPKLELLVLGIHRSGKTSHGGHDIAKHTWVGEGCVVLFASGSGNLLLLGRWDGWCCWCCLGCLVHLGLLGLVLLLLFLLFLGRCLAIRRLALAGNNGLLLFRMRFLFLHLDVLLLFRHVGKMAL
eukprot:m.224658 g.224658  ORF g.224658 m.224658 type:complete len:301 (-) comp16519_c0_seq1:176-1078(-)